jgi:hypothetical protein
MEEPDTRPAAWLVALFLAVVWTIVIGACVMLTGCDGDDDDREGINPPNCQSGVCV